MSRPFRVSKPLLIAAGVLLGMPLVVAAQPAGPHIEAGLWETGMEVSGFKMSSQMCMDGSEASTQRAFAPPSREQASAAADRACEKRDIHPVPGGYAINTTCTNSQGRVTHVSGTVLGDFKTHYTMDMTVENNGRPQAMHMESRRVGACPAGMRPGEARTQMDQGGVAAAIAAARARAAAGGGQ